VQSALRFGIEPTHPRKHLGWAVFGDTLAGDDLKATGPTGWPISTPDVAAIQANRNRRSGFGRGFDLKLASGIESELLGAQFHFKSLGSFKHMRANSLGVHAGIYGQHIV
jgi:hypothetical protein